MENMLDNVNTDLLNHILHLKVYKEGEHLSIDTISQMDMHILVEVHFTCVPSEQYKLLDNMKANMTVEELTIYMNLGVMVI